MDKLDNVLMAVDLRAADTELIRRLAGAIFDLYGNKAVTIEPVFVLQRYAKIIGRQIEAEIGRVEDAVQAHFNSVMRPLQIPGMKEPKVLLCYDNSIRQTARVLADYAASSHCQLLAINTRSRKGIGRLLLGSFAESVMYQARVPLLILNPHYRPRRGNGNRILYPTDLTADSQNALLAAAEHFKNTGKQIVVFHQTEPVSSPDFDAFLPVPIPGRLLRSEQVAVQQAGRDLIARLTALGVSAEFVYARKPRSVSEGVMLAARRNHTTLIAITSRSFAHYGTATSRIVSDIVRHYRQPILVLPTPAAAERHEQKPQEALWKQN